MRYGLNDKPKMGILLLYGFQWLAVSLPCVIIMGVIVARLHYSDLGDQVFYLQKLFGVTGLVMATQLLFGHRLPLVVGPAIILLAGLLASASSGLNVIYTSILVGSLILTIGAFSGLTGWLRAAFTPRIIAVILILITFTISPTILKLTLAVEESAVFHLIFASGLTLAMVAANQFLSGIWKSLTVLLGLVGGSLAYFILSSFPELPPIPSATGSNFFITALEFDPGSILAFLFCMLGLSINELGSIESIGHMLKADNMSARTKKGVIVAGLGNILAGATATLGPVSYALSSGIIAATGCASRLSLLPAAIGLAICALFPKIVLICSLLPGPVMGALLLYLMATQLASGLIMLFAERGVVDFGSGLTVGFPLMAGILISYAPPSAFQDFPSLIRPIISNGFIVGTIVVILMEHVIVRGSSKDVMESGEKM